MAGESFFGALTGGAIGSAVVKLTLDTQAYQSELDRTGKVTDATVKKTEASFAAFKTAAVGAAIGAGYALLRFGADSIRAASDLNESMTKAQVVFGASAESVQAFAESAAQSFGLSEQAALSAAGAFGQMLQTAGLTQAEAASMSVELTKLGADLASFNNIAIDGADGALAKLQSGLAGEAEPLRRLGVLLSAARVETTAYAEGIAEVGAELTEGQKVQARYALIMQDTALAQGDFARTSDGLANSQRILQAQLENTKATIGTALLPVVTDLASALNSVLVVLGPLLENIDLVLVAFASWVAVTKLLPLVLSVLNTVTATLSSTILGTTGTMQAFSAATYYARGAVFALSTVLTVGLTAALIAVPALLDSFSISLKKVAHDSGLSAKALKKLDDQLSFGFTKRTSFTGFLAQLDGTKDNVEEFSNAVQPAFADLQALGLDANQAAGYIGTMSMNLRDASGAALDEFTVMLEDNIGDLERWGKQLGENEMPVLRYTGLVEDLGFTHQQAMGLANAALDRYGAHLDDAGKRVRNFAGMTGEELQTWRKDTVQNIHDTFPAIGQFDLKWDQSAASMIRNAERSQQALKRYLGDLRTLEQTHISDALKKALVDEGPAYVDAFVKANDTAQTQIASDFQKHAGTFNKVKDVIAEITGKIDEVPNAKDIDVRVHYSYTGYDPRMPIPGG